VSQTRTANLVVNHAVSVRQNPCAIISNSIQKVLPCHFKTLSVIGQAKSFGQITYCLWCRGGFRLSYPTPLVTEITVLILSKCPIGSRNPPDLIRADPLNPCHPRSILSQNEFARNLPEIFPYRAIVIFFVQVYSPAWIV